MYVNALLAIARAETSINRIKQQQFERKFGGSRESPVT